MFMLFWQSILIFNQTHRNRWWTITLELLAKARELADTVEVVVAGDADSVAAELGDHGASVVYSIGPLDGGLAGPRIASAIAEAFTGVRSRRHVMRHDL